MIGNTILAGILQSGRQLWVGFDTAMGVVAQMVFVAHLYWLALLVPVCLVLGAITFALSRRNRRVAGAEGSEAVTPLGRPARSLARLLLLYMFVGPATTLLLTPLGGWGFVYTAVAFDLMSMALVLLLLSAVGDLRVSGAVAGRDMRDAYLSVTVGVPLAATAGYLLAVVAVAL